MLDLPSYCREIETHLCRKNDGHLIRIVGPSFEIVSGWAELGVPVKVACSGIDRYFERYYRKGPRRRPVKIDFCEADVLDLFDEWRRAIGLTATPADIPQAGERAAEVDIARQRRGPSLPEHLERALTKLSSLRARGVLTEASDSLIDRVSAELDAARASTAGLRGDARRQALERLAALDDELVAVARGLLPTSVLEAVEQEAREELAPYRESMDAAAFGQAVDRAATHGLRERLGLPTIGVA